jgi:hypothetical protein
MSDTPQTDARIGIISNGSNVVDVGWARQLERERDEARGQCLDLLFSQRMLPIVMAERDQLRAQVETLKAANSDVRRIADERNAAEREVEQLKAYAERLKEAGDWMAVEVKNAYSLKNWQKAKEIKP